MANLPFPKSFPDEQETRFLRMILSRDEDFPRLWKEWKDATVFEDVNHATSRLLAFAYSRIQKLGIQDELSGRVKGIHKSAWVKNQRLIYAAKEVAQACAEEGIPVLLLKGIPLLSEVYKDRGARFLGDADILIEPKYGPRVIELMRKKGWEYAHPWVADRHHPVPSVFRIMKSSELRNDTGIEMDIHWNIFRANHGVRLPSVFLLRKLPALSFREYFWEHTVPMDLDGVACRRLSNEDMLVHLIVHGAEGNAYRALRWVLDAAMIIRTLPLDWDAILERAREYGLALELKLGFAYLAQFGLPVPTTFSEKLDALPVSHDARTEYYRTANTEHSRRVNVLGNIPLLWYAYWRFEPDRSLFGFPAYVRAAWGLKRNRDVLPFATAHILRKLEGRHPALLNGIRKVVRDGAYLVSGKGLAFLASFAAVTVLGRVVPRETVGSYNYVLAVLAIMSIATLPGMNDALVRAIGRGNDGTVHAMLRKRLLFGIAGSIGAALMGAWTWTSGNPVLGAAFLIAAPFVPITDTFSNFAVSFWQGKRRFDRSALVAVAYYGGLALISIPFFVLSDDLRIIIAGVMLAQAAVGYAVYQTVRPGMAGVDQDSMRLGMHLTAMQAFGILANNLDKVIVWWLFGPVTVAIYTFAATPISKLYQIIPIGTIALPYLSARSFTVQVKREVLRTTALLFLASIPAVAILIMLAPWIYRVFFPLYPDSVPYFQLMLLSLALVPNTLVRAALVAFEQTKSLYMTEVGLAVVRISLMTALAFFFGIYGLVAALLIMSVTYSAMMLGLFLRARSAG